MVTDCDARELHVVLTEHFDVSIRRKLGIVSHALYPLIGTEHCRGAEAGQPYCPVHGRERLLPIYYHVNGRKRQTHILPCSW